MLWPFEDLESYFNNFDLENCSIARTILGL